MPRPCKRRLICSMPDCRRFVPEGAPECADEGVTMSVDEFESIRLIDLEGLTQEECAERMDVSRTTAQSIICSARAKIAECLVLGRQLRIEGGSYQLCDGDAPRRGCGKCHR